MTALLLAGSLAWAFAAQAGTTTFKGVSVDYGSATKTTSGDDVILTYTASGSLKLGGPAKARILLVAGGGSGSSGGSSGSSSNKSGYGGYGGVVLDESDVLLGGDYDITVGAGGAGVKGSDNSRTQGAPGGNSTIINSFSKSIIRQAYGGGGGGDATPSGSGTASNITGSNKTYGANGSNKTTSGSGSEAAVNTGNGGQGGYGGSSSGKGGSGIVVIRLTAAVEGANLKDLTVPLDGTVSEFRDASDQPKSFVFSDVTCVSSADSVVGVVETSDGKLGLLGRYPGLARVTVVEDDKTYLINVSVDSLITGKIRVGAYEVEVQNASRTNWVNGDLVITYLDTTAAKTFKLPKPTTGQLLAVGGGGAGGQDSARDTNYGLPGGGGAGGMVTKDNQAFAAATYTVMVGAGGQAPHTLTKKNGASGGDSIVKQGTTALATAKGGGGGGARSAGSDGGCGGGGSYYSSKTTAVGGATQQESGLGHAGGTGGNKLYGAGGGGAGTGGADCNTTSSSSGAGGAGVVCNITGEDIEYARGGDGGVPRVNTTYKSGGKEYWVEAEDGKPGLDGRGNGGGGGGHYSSSATYAGSGGSGVVIVRIPPYKTTVEDALRWAFAGQPVEVSDDEVRLDGDVEGPIRIPDNLGAVTVNLNGHNIVGVNGAPGSDIRAGGDGAAALEIVPHTYGSENDLATMVAVAGTGTLRGGNGGTGHPAGHGAEAVAGNASDYEIGESVMCEKGTDGAFIDQHPHKWAYTIEDNKIIAYCIAEDGEPCSYRDDHSCGPVLAVSAADAAYTAMRYDELTTVNGITPVTGIVIAPETYVGRDGTAYPETTTPPREQGAYTVSMQLGDLKITSDFTITEPKPSQGSVYQAWKTAERKGRDVQIALSATFDGSKAINDGNVLFLGSRCSAHSMGNGTVESSVNALALYANVRWYAYGSKEPSNNKVNMLTPKGETVPANTVTLVGGNHFVHKEMMDDLYAELVEKKNRADGYDLLILEFDGDLLGRNGESPYQLVYSLPEGWTDEKAAVLRQAMSRYYDENRVVWIVPDKDQTKSDPGWTGNYPWTSKPEFVWQRALLNATETEGYKVPEDHQKNYEHADELVDFLKKVLVGHFFSKAVIKDKLAEGLTIKKVTPQMRSDGGIWRDFNGGPEHYTIFEPRSEKNVKADVKQTGRQVEVTFDMREEQAWACENEKVIGDDLRVVIDAELDPAFFSGVGEGESQETNEGPATFDFTESNLDGEETYALPTIEKDSPTIKNEKLTPDYTAEDVVRIYDGKGTNIVVKPIAPTPDEAVIRYSLDEHGTYVDNFALTNVCDKTKVWFTITDNVGEFTTVTNYATVTILPRVVVEQAEDATKAYDGTPLTQPAHSNVLSRAIAEAEKMYPGQGASAAGFVSGEGFANVPMTADSQQTEIGSHANTIDKTAVTVNEKTDKNNYVFIYLPGELKVTSGTFTASASPALKVYDGEPTNIAVTVTGVPSGVTPTYEYSYSETEGFVPASEFTGPTNVSESAAVYCKVTVPGCGEKTVSADVTILRRYVVEQAGSAEKAFDNTPLVCGDHDERPAEELKDALAAYEELYGEEIASSATGFVGADAFASVPMTGDSTITDPGVVSNTIDSAAVTFTPSYDPDNYSVRYLQGELRVTPAAFTASAEPVEKFYDSVPTNIIVTVSGIPDGVTPTCEYSYSETEGFVSAANFTGPTNVSESAEIYCRVSIPGTTNVVSATATIKPRIVVEQADSASKIFDGTPLVQPNHYEETDVEAEKSKEKWGTAATLANSTGFVPGEGFAGVPMTADSTITEPGVEDNVIDVAAVTLRTDTKAGNYIFYYLPGELAVIQRQEEVRRDPEIVVPEESRTAVEESDKKIEEVLNELVKGDPKVDEEPYIKYQLTVTPTSNLNEATRTSPEKAAADAKRQIDLFEKTVPAANVDKAEFVDVVLERTYDKNEAEETAKGNYNKENWTSLDKAEEHGNRLFEITVPLDVPEGMELVGVTRSCDNKGTEVLKPKDPNDPNAEGFVHNPETKTVTLYAKDFCVFGFMMQNVKKDPPSSRGGCTPNPTPAANGLVYRFKAQLHTTKGVVQNTGSRSPCSPSEGSCLVMRGRDKTVIEGWIVSCSRSCGGLESGTAVLWDSRRQAPVVNVLLETQFLNIMGARNTDAEWAWTLSGEVVYDAMRSQEFVLEGAGYGSYDASLGLYETFGGCLAGMASAPYDLKARRTEANASCICDPSSVLTCDTVEALEWTVNDTVVFGRWKVRLNKAASTAYGEKGVIRVPDYARSLLR